MQGAGSARVQDHGVNLPISADGRGSDGRHCSPNGFPALLVPRHPHPHPHPAPRTTPHQANTPVSGELALRVESHSSPGALHTVHGLPGRARIG